MVSGGSLPAVSGEKTYINPSIPGMTVGVALSQLGPFFGIFFGTKGPHGEWPHAWWSFCFVSNFFASFQWFGATQVYKVVRTSGLIEFRNMYMGIIESLSLADVESVTEESGFCGRYLSVAKTDAKYEEQRETAGRWKCCVRKKICFRLPKESHAAFLQDHGMSQGTNFGNAAA